MSEGSKSPYLGELEELVLLAILKLGPSAYGVPIQEALQGADRHLSVGALYVTLDRLQRKGFVTSWRGEPTPERGGRAKRYYRVESSGKLAIYQAESSRKKLNPEPAPGRA
jgi:PadR family transcriptional regulator PadR